MSVLLYVIIVFIIIIILVIGIYRKWTNTICGSKKRLEGKTVLVTGGTAGMGLEIAGDFADRGARVIIACPFPDEGEEARKSIIKKTENDQVIFKLLDLSSLASVRKFAADINNAEDRLDILVNNAGVGGAGDSITKDGMNFIMQVNYYGQFLLTLLLLPLLKKHSTASETVRIVNTASYLHYFGNINFDANKNIKQDTGPRMYITSKLCVVLFTHELAKWLKGSNVVVNSVDPGSVGTGIFNCHGKWLGRFITIVTIIFSKTPWEGCQTALHVALDREAGKVSGQYFCNCKLSRASQRGYDDKIAKQLWEQSVRIVGLSDEQVEQCIKV